MEVADNTWAVQDAKARFSELLEASAQRGPQIVTRHGAEAAVVISVAEWRRLQAAVRPSLKAWLLNDKARGELDIPPRSSLLVGPPPELD